MKLPPIQYPVQEFGPCVRSILGAHQVSASELARMLSYRSRNSIFRILDGSGAHSARQAFLDRLIEEDPLRLSQEEAAQLRQALEISRVGINRFMSNRAMHELLVDSSEKNNESHITIIPASSRRMSGHDFMESFPEWKELHIRITGCCDRQLFDFLARHMAGRKMEGRLMVTHFVSVSEAEVVRSLSAIQPLLYEEFYQAYMVEPGVFSEERECFYRSNQVYVYWRDLADNEHERLYQMVDKQCFCFVGQCRGHGFGAVRRIMEEDMKRMQPLKSAFPRADSHAAYIEYTEACRRLEHGKTILAIKPDIPLSFVHPDIARAALVDGMRALGYGEEYQADPTVGKLYDIQTMRYANFFDKHRNTSMVFSLEAMERFAATGRQRDHFFMLRAYTPQERSRILRNLRLHAEKNPNISVYFLKPGFVLSGMEIALYEGVGTLIAEPDTDYNLQNHTEVLLTQNEFCMRYKQYFTDNLLEYWVRPQEETLALLDRLIGIAEQE